MLKQKFNIETQMINKMKTHLGHLFIVDEVGNLNLKPIDKIPQFKMIFVKGGEFMMGSDLVHIPPHPVKLTYNFFIGEFPVTQEFYLAITGNNPSSSQGIKHPVEYVNWIEAMNFCNLLNKKLGLNPICDKDYELLDSAGNKSKDITKVSGFRLPTEAEWEYAARGGVLVNSASGTGADLAEAPDYKYTGSNHLDEVGWFGKNNSYETKPVGLKFPNKLGIYDMSGNVTEWCLDWYDEDFFKEQSLTTNPNNTNKTNGRVTRGGSWKVPEVLCMVAVRQFFLENFSWPHGGFRLVFSFHTIDPADI